MRGLEAPPAAVGTQRGPLYPEPPGRQKELKKPVSPDYPGCPKPDDGSVDADDPSSGPASPQRDGNEAGAEKTDVSTVDGGSGESATAIDGDGAERNTNPSEGASTRPDERHAAKQLQDNPTSSEDEMQMIGEDEDE